MTPDPSSAVCGDPPASAPDAASSVLAIALPPPPPQDCTADARVSGPVRIGGGPPPPAGLNRRGAQVGHFQYHRAIRTTWAAGTGGD